MSENYSTKTEILANYGIKFDKLLGKSVFGLLQKEKEKFFLPIISLLHEYHLEACPSYSDIFQNSIKSESLHTLPFLAVRLFKHLELLSVDSDELYKQLRSSGTSGQAPAKIFLDKSTSSRQSQVLVKILQEFIGKQRLPMLIIDSPSTVKDKTLFNARGAGIQGLAFFGRDHTYALDEKMQPNWPVIEEFVSKYSGQPVLVFGFTFMVWLHFIQQMQKNDKQFYLPHGVLLHSGGWKKLEAEKVDNDAFKLVVEEATGITKINNFYGMAEQVGSVFVECEYGHLHAPVFADLIVRDPYSLDVLPVGKQGIIQVLSALPTSYPGHSILTEDLGTIQGIDDCKCGRKGKYFSIQGRLPKTEVRGCSDTYGEEI